MFAHGKLARLVVMMSPRLGPRLTLLSRLPWTVLKMGAKSGEMSHAPANTALSWPKRNFNAIEAVPAPAHNSITDSPCGKLTKDSTVSLHTESVVHGGWMPRNCFSSKLLSCSWIWVSITSLCPKFPRMDVQGRVEVNTGQTEPKHQRRNMN